jgi:hypothetical protein
LLQVHESADVLATAPSARLHGLAATVILGVLFNSAILTLVETLAHLGAMGLALVLTACAVYVLGRWWKRQLFIDRARRDDRPG